MSKYIVAGHFGGAFSTKCKDRSPVPDYTCGHLHRSQEAAQKCLEELLGWDKDRKNCSAKWYNARILKSAETESGWM